jgi:hypothetical protein
LVENALIGASLASLWLLPLRQMGWKECQGLWVEFVLGGALLAMLVVAVLRVGRWADAGWRRDGGSTDGRGRHVQ